MRSIEIEQQNIARQKHIDRVWKQKAKQIKKKIDIENLHTKQFLENKERIKKKRLQGIINAEVNIESLNDLMHQLNVWNAWDQVDRASLEQPPSGTLT
eukprot:CAMPEP_0205812722 /NCGR_PEP_ID=MMETSP0205-20121125/17269_1 /ASSEMBLY_ACC=CAM_ASM_000278 /TAXON_ID=36767 /ORGANISM="Euplotes focardii, Strain TN1" /LENGTH=97 /DNA_ID=CAMNT_0053093871 /DNA_START=143 /DNA_END=436 /DNA_ORIENTATION=-